MDESLVRDLAVEYSNKSVDYARLWSPVIRPMALPLLAGLPLSTAHQVLDCGTGTGALIPDLEAATRNGRIVAIDRAEGMLKHAPKSPRNTFCIMDAGALAFQDDVFDVTTLIFVLFHLPDPLAALREAMRTLRPGGALGVVVWGKDMDVPGLDIWAEELDRIGAAPDPRAPEFMRHSEMNDLSKLGALLVSSGAQRVRTFAQRFEYQWTAEALAAVQVACGSAGRRAEMLPRDASADCSARVLTRFREMPDEQLRYHPEILYAVAEKATQ